MNWPTSSTLLVWLLHVSGGLVIDLPRLTGAVRGLIHGLCAWALFA